ncbi:hypothetical protein ACFQ6U_09875 [Streptomyces sp. NPDC056465]|uniref:hypothetical protein n=1 Tax=unclassified Streptomyces TaxID=2593676 RepID=UPI0035D7AFE5
MTTYDFPQDLCDAQLALHQTRAAYEQYARTLPWSAEPMPGWEGDKQVHSDYRSSKPDSPGYTEEQHREVAAFRARFLELSITVSTHPFWATLERSAVVAGRMALKHTHEDAAAATDGAV